MKFALGAILSIVGDKLMCDITAIYQILDYMTNDKLFTHQLPRASRECRPYLLRQFPFLEDYIDNIQPKITTENYGEILFECQEKWGKELEVEPIPRDDHSYRHPLDELKSMVGKDKIIVCEMEKETE
jgi:hypothetical protein